MSTLEKTYYEQEDLLNKMYDRRRTFSRIIASGKRISARLQAEYDNMIHTLVVLTNAIRDLENNA